VTTLYAGTWVGEFGWELFCWQGYLRKKAKQFDRCIVACRAGHEVLYEDFAETTPQNISSEECDMWDCKAYSIPPFEEIFGCDKGRDVWYPPRQAVLRYDHTHKLDNKPLFAKFKEQEYVTYGNPQPQSRDVIIHARFKQNKVNAGMTSNYRNWSLEKWYDLVSMIGEERIACIGTKKSALHVGGQDMRGLSLRQLCDTLASAKVIVGPSSGPMHLAALCLCPQVLWYGHPYKNNEIRYLKDWNPFSTHVEIMHDNKWDVPVNAVFEKVENVLELDR